MTDHSYEIETGLIEMDALNASIKVVEGATTRSEAICLVEQAFSRFRIDPHSIEDRVVDAAMRKIVGKPINSCLLAISTSTWEIYTTQTLSIAWINWARGHRGFDGEAFEGWAKESDGSAIHITVLDFWRGAIKALNQNDPAEARRLFKRAIDFGAQHGTESHRLVSWAYAASFFTAEDSL